MKYLLDSYAWIEYFKGTLKGQKVKEIIENKNNNLFTLDICLAEIKFWALQEKIDFSKICIVIRVNSEILECTSDDWLNAAEIKFEQRKKISDFGLVDAAMIAKQEEKGMVILTGDKHFKENKKALLI